MSLDSESGVCISFVSRLVMLLRPLVQKKCVMIVIYLYSNINQKPNSALMLRKRTLILCWAQNI